jgi:diaminopimelate decarboxylase
MPSPRPFPLLRTEIAGVAVRDIAERFGTPTYVYDAAVIAERIADLAAFDGVRYAQKANSNLAILDFVRRQGALVDAVSGNEIRRAIAAGYAPTGDPHPIEYTSDIFDRDALEAIAQYGVHVNCGSPDMLDQLAARLGGREITLRINPGFGHGHSQKTSTGGEGSKHGIWHEELPEVVARAGRLGHRITGLHVHIGSGTDLKHLASVCGAMEKFAPLAGEHLAQLSAGGGLPVPYREGQTYVDLEQYFGLWDASRRKLEKALGRKLRLEIEPGRYIVAESGYLVAEIRAVKRQGKNRFYLLDAGFNVLARPILYGAYHPMSIVPSDGNLNRPAAPTVVGGPLCESGDIFTQEEGGFVAPRELPEARVGELLVIEVAGAYGFVMSSNYNSQPLPAEVMIKEGKPHLVRARQTFADVIRGEVIPS